MRRERSLCRNGKRCSKRGLNGVQCVKAVCKDSLLFTIPSFQVIGKIREVLVDTELCTALHCTALHCTALHCTALHCTALHCTALHCITLHCTVLHCLHCITLHCTALHCTALHCTALHCTALHCTALHCTALHCTALHCTDSKCLGMIKPLGHLFPLNADLLPQFQYSSFWRQKDQSVSVYSQRVKCLLKCGPHFWPPRLYLFDLYWHLNYFAFLSNLVTSMCSCEMAVALGEPSYIGQILH